MGNLTNFQRLDFHDQVLLERKGKLLYESLYNNLSQHMVSFSQHGDFDGNSEDQNLFIRDVPDYLQTFPIGKHKVHRSVKTFSGSLIHLDKHQDFSSYLNAHFSTKKRSQFRMYRKRLEDCFTIEHKIYYGHIERENYEYLFDCFKSLLKERFEQKKEINDSLMVWGQYYKTAFDQINRKEACLSTICHEGKPIAMSLNFILGSKIVFGYVKTYDIAYSKFGLGYTESFNMIKWAYQNKMEIFDLLKGSYDYKDRFTDGIYHFKKELIYSKRKLWPLLMGNLFYIYLKSFYALYEAYTTIKKAPFYTFFKKHLTKTGNIIPYQRETRMLEIDHWPLDHMYPVAHNNIPEHWMKKVVYDHCFDHKTTLKSLQLFLYKNSKEHLFIHEGESVLEYTMN